MAAAYRTGEIGTLAGDNESTCPGGDRESVAGSRAVSARDVSEAVTTESEGGWKVIFL